MNPGTACQTLAALQLHLAMYPGAAILLCPWTRPM